MKMANSSKAKKGKGTSKSKNSNPKAAAKSSGKKSGITSSSKTVTLHQKLFFSVPRHKLIASKAQALLSSKAEGNIAALLSGIQVTTLSAIAGWADEIKHRNAKPSDDIETQNFKANALNSSMGSWHYVDLPLGASDYDRTKYKDFTRDDDVVQMTIESLRVLQGQSPRFSKINALRLLVHLIGDLHQPLHIACGYIQKEGNNFMIISDPKVILDNSLKDDVGGNNLLLQVDGKRISFHSYWDSALDLEGDKPSHSSPAKSKYEAALSSFVKSPPLVPLKASSGAKKNWEPEIVSWANDSLRAARTAYEGIKITSAGQRKNTYNIEYTGPGSYEDRCLPIANERVELATERLALILEDLFG